MKIITRLITLNYSQKIALFSIGLAASVLLSVGHGAAAQTTQSPAANTPPAATCEVHDFFGLLPWYAYLKSDLDSNCDIQNFTLLPGAGQHSDLVLILLAIIDDLLRIAGVIAIGFIVFAAFNFITSQGNPEDAAKARGTAINALIGLIIAMFAIVLVSFIGSKLGG